MKFINIYKLSNIVNDTNQNQENPKEEKTINDKKTGNSVVKVKDKKGEYPLIRTGSEVYQPTHREWVKWVNTKFTKN